MKTTAHILIISLISAVIFLAGSRLYLNFMEDGDDLIVPVFEPDGTEYERAGYEFSAIIMPLPPGEHVIKLHGEWSDPFDSFVSDVTYYITVLPGKRKK